MGGFHQEKWGFYVIFRTFLPRKNMKIRDFTSKNADLSSDFTKSNEIVLPIWLF